MKKGASLIEMLLVIIFIGVAFLSVLQLLIAALNSERDTEGTMLAMHLASEKMEQLINANFTSISSEVTAEVADFTGYFREARITSVEANLKDIKVFVYWEVAGSRESYQMETLKNRYF